MYSVTFLQLKPVENFWEHTVRFLASLSVNLIQYNKNSPWVRSYFCSGRPTDAQSMMSSLSCEGRGRRGRRGRGFPHGPVDWASGALQLSQQAAGEWQRQERPLRNSQRVGGVGILQAEIYLLSAVLGQMKTHSWPSLWGQCTGNSFSVWRMERWAAFFFARALLWQKIT